MKINPGKGPRETVIIETPKRKLFEFGVILSTCTYNSVLDFIFMPLTNISNDLIHNNALPCDLSYK